MLPKNSKQMKTSFFFDTVPDIFRLINSLSRNLLVHLSIKKSGKEFLYHIDFKNSISVCKVMSSAHMLYARNKRVWIKPF